MPLYMCNKCGTVENTALGGYWMQQLSAFKDNIEHKPLCSACDPKIGKWHDHFPRRPASGYVQDKQGYLYLPPSDTKRMTHMGPFTPVVLPQDKEGKQL